MLDDIVNITLLRHGRSRADDEKVHEGRYDSPLTKEGIRQAKALGNYWQGKSVTFDKIVCSPLQRAAQTAEIIANSLDSNIEISQRWMEFDNGPLAAMHREEAAKKYPVPEFRNRFDAFTKDGGESDASFNRRINLALEELFQNDSKNVLVVAHGGSLNKAIRDLTASGKGYFAFGDTAFANLRYNRKADSCLIIGVNQQPHLKD